jgi:hypothetical protein
MIPAGAALRSLLALKLFGTARHGHVMSVVMDRGLALFAGLNVIPKRSFFTEYSCRIDPTCYPELMRRWFDAVGRLGLPRGQSFDLDFHTIPFHGEDALIGHPSWTSKALPFQGSDSCEMIIVVLRDEEHQVNRTHRSL